MDSGSGLGGLYTYLSTYIHISWLGVCFFFTTQKKKKKLVCNIRKQSVSCHVCSCMVSVDVDEFDIFVYWSTKPPTSYSTMLEEDHDCRPGF